MCCSLNGCDSAAPKAGRRLPIGHLEMRLLRSSRRGLEEAGIGENGVEELTPAKQATADTCSANPLRKAALVVVAVTILLFALSIVMERFTPSSSQAVVQAYIVRMAPEVAGRV